MLLEHRPFGFIQTTPLSAQVAFFPELIHRDLLVARRLANPGGAETFGNKPFAALFIDFHVRDAITKFRVDALRIHVVRLVHVTVRRNDKVFVEATLVGN